MPQERIQQLIEMAAKSVKFGTLNVELGVHDGEVRYLYGNEHATKNFSSAGLQEAVEYFLQCLARERNMNTTGALTVTFQFTAGNVKRVDVHRGFRQDLTGQKK